MFRAGCSPVALSWAGLVTTAIVGLIVKPILVIKIVDYTWKDIFSVFIPCLKVTLISLPLPLVFNFFVHVDNRFVYITLMAIMCVASVCAATWFLGMTPRMKEKVLAEVRKRVKF